MDHFASVVFSPFLSMNPVDVLLDLANGNNHDISVPAELVNTSHAEGKDSHGDQFPGSLSSHDVLEYLVEAYETNVAPIEKEKLMTLNEVTEDLKSSVSTKYEWGATWWDQFSILFVHGLKERCHEYLSFLRISQVILIALILGLLWWQSKIDTTRGLQDQIGLVFFISVFWGFFPIFTVIFIFPQEQAMLAKERAIDMYRLSVYFMARILSDLPLDLFLPIGFFIILYFMVHLRMIVAAFFLTMLMTFLNIFSSQGLELAIGATFMDLKKATTLASITMMEFMLVGGFFVQRVHPFIKWIRAS